MTRERMEALARQYAQFGQYVARKVLEYGERFDPSELEERFVPHYRAGRIKVDLLGRTDTGAPVYGHTIITGSVGVTTGWRPKFLLLRTSRSTGSSWLLGRDDRVIGVQRGRTYAATGATADRPRTDRGAGGRRRFGRAGRAASAAARMSARIALPFDGSSAKA